MLSIQVARSGMKLAMAAKKLASEVLTAAAPSAVPPLASA